MKHLRTTLFVLCTCIVLLSAFQFFFCPRYTFTNPKPFSGSQINNPYGSADPAKWVKCNFHAHAHSWGGITNGHGTARDVHQAYQKLNYGVHCVSNYHHIDTTSSGDINYIPAYEHGYNIQKTHQLILGNRTVTWLDYIFPQTIHNKQHLLERLREPGSLIILNHPALRKGYTNEDLSLLTGYDCMEVLNPSVTSTAEWDAALSAGRPAFIVGDDDIHDVLSKRRLGTRCTFVNVDTTSAGQVLSALKAGRSYGVLVAPGQDHSTIPSLLGFTLYNDSIVIEMSKPAQRASITGQNGKLLKKAENISRLTYKIKPADHYARATFQYDNGTTVFLNPVYYSEPGGHRVPPAQEDFVQTIFFRILGVCLLLFWVLVGRLWMSSKPPKRGGTIKRRREYPVFQD